MQLLTGGVYRTIATRQSPGILCRALINDGVLEPLKMVVERERCQEAGDPSTWPFHMRPGLEDLDMMWDGVLGLRLQWTSLFVAVVTKEEGVEQT
jgi:hypothetical protein